ncbi:MAG: asparagine synthetase A [Candidatus Bathyarchaeota archaeon]|jgi:asparaginyl-tRNA synthetase
MDSIKQRYLTIREPKSICVLKIQDGIIAAMREYLREKEFIEILAPIIGPVTDPGIRGAKQVSIDYYGTEFKLMSSMILYKQMAVSSLRKVFSISPNIRIEPLETVKTRRHLTEFRQVDIEAAYATYEEMMRLGEEMLCHVIRDIKEKFQEELRKLKRELKVPKKPFTRYTHREAIDILKSLGFKLRYEEEIPWDAEEEISAVHKEPFWVTDYPITARGFYYPEHPKKPGFLRDFDLLYPEGYGEAISGGEREHRYERVVERMKQDGEDPTRYDWYLEMLKKGIPSSAGFGIGVERLTRYVCGTENIWEAVAFPKVAGVISP